MKQSYEPPMLEIRFFELADVISNSADPYLYIPGLEKEDVFGEE